jgi:Protein of unknown function (DUF2867)
MRRLSTRRSRSATAWSRLGQSRMARSIASSWLEKVSAPASRNLALTSPPWRSTRSSGRRRSPTGPCTGSRISAGVPDGTDGYRGQMAVLVKPNGLLGIGYMAVIRPFRHLIVYPC